MRTINFKKYSFVPVVTVIIFLLFICILLSISWNITEARKDIMHTNLTFISRSATQNILISENKISFINNLIKNEKLNNDSFYALVSTFDNKYIIKSPQLIEEIVAPMLRDFSSKDFHEKLYDVGDISYILNYVPNNPFILIVGTKHELTTYKAYFYNLLPYKFELSFCILILAGLIYLLYISILKPLTSMSKTILDIANTDLNLDVIKAHSYDEIIVALALEKIKSSMTLEKELISQLSQAQNDLAITNLRLENKVRDRTQELEKTIADRGMFQDYLNHEIILPLQEISDTASNLSKNWSTKQEELRLKLVTQIALSSNNLLLMVSNLLDSSKFSKNKVGIKPSRFNLADLTHKIMNECKLLYMNKKSVCFNFVDGEISYIIADEERISQVLRNLFVNAINFSANNSSVAISISKTKISIGNDYQEALHYMVYDHGVGIDDSELVNIFSPFEQGKMIKNKAGSVGLGLYICLQIITSHHGKIWAVNNKDGGATFNFIIPLVQPVEIPIDLTSPSSLALHHENPNIIIIDDEEACLNSMELLLHNTKYNLIKTNSGRAGIKYLKKHYKSISLIMLDLMMPDMYGLNVLAEIKKINNLRDIPVILQTGTIDEEEVIKAFDLGIISLLRKPYKKQTVLNEIKKALNES